jgi:hypothetical protein
MDASYPANLRLSSPDRVRSTYPFGEEPDDARRMSSGAGGSFELDG